MLMGLIALVILFMTRDATFTNDNFVGWALWQYIMTAVPFALITAGLSKNLGLATTREKTARRSSSPSRSEGWDGDLGSLATGSWSIFFSTLFGVALMTVGLSSFATQSMPFNGIFGNDDHNAAWPETLHTVSIALLAVWWPLSGFLVYRTFPTDELGDRGQGIAAAIVWAVAFWPLMFLPAYT